jgi:2-dehydro-3-deoxyphosphooctonate aldolase (KDO 8-P synthase)
MRFAKEKVESSGGDTVWLTERGTTFGYQDLVVDFRSIPIMKQFGAEVVMDCTHSLQQPNQSAGVTGGRPQLIETMACAAAAVGARGLFIETHHQPEIAKSDAANMLPLDKLEQVVRKSMGIYELMRDSSEVQS